MIPQMGQDHHKITRETRDLWGIFGEFPRRRQDHFKTTITIPKRSQRLFRAPLVPLVSVDYQRLANS